MSTPSNVFDALNDEISRVEELRHAYIEIGDAGMFGLMVLNADLTRAKKARSDMDTVAMIGALQSLREIKS